MKTTEQQKRKTVNVYRNGIFDNNCYIPDLVQVITKKWLVEPCLRSIHTSHRYGNVKKHFAKMKTQRDRNTVHINTRALSTKKYINKY